MEFMASFVENVLVYTTVYTLASLGILLAGRTGIFNVAGEGIMLASASAGFLAAFLSGNYLVGFICGATVGALFGLVLIFIHETFKVNQFILGICLVIFGSGFSDLLYKLVIGVRLSAPIAPDTPRVVIPFLEDMPILAGLFNNDVIVYFMFFATLVAWWFLYKTKLGLEMRAIGENPKAADVAGINVYRARYLATIIGSALIGIAGAYLTITITKTYSPDISAGRGFMAIGIAIFASWKPQRAIVGGFIFAFIEVFSFQLQIISDKIPFQLFLMLPFISVLVIMIIYKKHIEFPASVGKPYSRE